MEGGAVPAEAPPQRPDCGAASPPGPPACRPQEEGGASGRARPPANADSDATESADSEEEAEPPSPPELRRSSSSSVHSGEDADPDTLEAKQFMKRYVEKVFHGR